LRLSSSTRRKSPWSTAGSGNHDWYCRFVRAAVGVVGVLIVLAGGVFAGQGLGYIPGSVMTGDIRWFWIGSVMVVIGLALGVAGFLGRPRKA
jgi:hypothetical protein